MKYSVTFPPEAGQFAGTHWFFRKSERDAFLSRTAKRGVPVEKAVLRG